MAQDLGLHHSRRQAPPNEAGVLRRADDERKSLFDLMEATAPAQSERESQRVMDRLLRECLKRKPPLP
jgi:hypothetical protein